MLMMISLILHQQNCVHHIKPKHICSCALRPVSSLVYIQLKIMRTLSVYSTVLLCKCVCTLCIPVLTYMHISSFTADTSGSVLWRDSNLICSLYVQLRHSPGIQYCVPIIFFQMFPATFLQCALLSHSSH